MQEKVNEAILNYQNDSSNYYVSEACILAFYL